MSFESNLMRHQYYLCVNCNAYDRGKFYPEETSNSPINCSNCKGKECMMPCDPPSDEENPFLKSNNSVKQEAVPVVNNDSQSVN